MIASEWDLVLDVGNTRTKAGCFRHGRLMRHAIFPNNDLTGLRDLTQNIEFRHGVLGSVYATEASWIHEIHRLAPFLIVHGDTSTPLRMAYATPGSLGADRLANAVGAWRMMPGRAALVADLGTCITYDIVASDGTYIGGAISPGMNMRALAMHTYSAKLPLVLLKDPVPEIGNTTDTSLEVGIHHGIVLELEGFIARYRQQYADLGVILTGGDALRFTRALKIGIFAHPFLTLEGLYAILDHHRSVLGFAIGDDTLGGVRPGSAG